MLIEMCFFMIKVYIDIFSNNNHLDVNITQRIAKKRDRFLANFLFISRLSCSQVHFKNSAYA